MARVEPRLGWTERAEASPALAPGRALSPHAGWALWTVAVSAVVHAGFVALVATVEPAARPVIPGPTIEVEIVAPETPEATDAPEAPPDPVAPTAPPEPVAVAPAPVDTPPAPEVAKVEPAPEPEPVVAPVPVEPPPPKPQPPAVVKAPPERPKPPPRPAPPAPPQTAALPPPPVRAHGTEGTSNVPTEMAPAATVRAVVQPKPDYPLIARQLNEEGTVIVTVEVGTDGLPREITLRQSSGYGSLDQAAIEVMRRWRFAPAIHNGHPVATTVDIPLIFKLRRSASGG
jgi:protein TonB